MYLLARYFNERLLYRGFCKPVQGQFLLLKGGLLYAMNGLEARPTVDVDFMADRISFDRISGSPSKKSWVSYAMKMGCHLTQEVSK